MAFAEQLAELYDMEFQTQKALEEMLSSAVSPTLRNALHEHRDQTIEQTQRLVICFDQIHEAPKRSRCIGMEGLVAEAHEIMEQAGSPTQLEMDMALAMMKVEHYEIAFYTSLLTIARFLDLPRVEDILTVNRRIEEDAADLAQELLGEMLHHAMHPEKQFRW